MNDGNRQLTGSGNILAMNLLGALGVLAAAQQSRFAALRIAVLSYKRFGHYRIGCVGVADYPYWT
jgi:hypothetical protein